ncbi:MFS transporter [Bacillus cereus]|uniref:MFS transporter n=4 Tax=Bacillus cereus group TaxID=86661 RepID=A0A2B6AF69_9BACI|nr:MULTISPECIES: MDR family MFS transporter [Bacillus]EJS69159.1 drug:H+ antiporter-2 (14 Spanner) (DHA2) family drug resistance MFS transporter [Bacillus wiedmannii]EJV64079.1 drug:H+ antiporter-2 (14 Spanner) (DHA2) family drug resistance MFS transporter [Bacillus wiedmannii]KAA0788442.1 MFS transporter [Bacillus sp. BPN334]MBY7120928.1 MFS transporter [Bacillus sp. 16GRE42]MDR4941926.1 MDR family MFS transporter [Bacillus wiedmannii]
MVEKNNKLGFVVAGLLLGILMASMDNTIVVTAMGTIVGDLGGLENFVWVVSAYMVAEMAGMPIFGKLSDMYGRKRFFIFGLIVFMIGSALCGTAENITQLGIYRAIQGIGGGALVPIAFTIVFDIFPPEKRGKMGGLFGAVFGLSSIFGPLLGAYITDYISWHWVFYINLPLGVLALIFITFFYKESRVHRKQKIDWFGAITLVGAVVSLMFALELGGQKYDWDSNFILSLFGGFAILIIAFIFIERKVEEPIISFEMFKQRLFGMSTIIALCYGAAFMSATVYIPLFIQGVYGGSATNSGLLLLPMMLGSVVTAQLGGFLTTKLSYRNIMIISAVIMLIGLFLLSTLTPETSRILLTVYMIIIGFGVGFSFSVLSMAAIHNFGMEQRGSATSTSNFIRSLGMTLGITIFGMIQRTGFQDQLEEAFKGMSGGMNTNALGDSRAILSESARSQIPPQILDKIIDALSSSIVQTFMWALVPAGLAFIFIFFMGNERMVIKKKQTNKKSETSKA